MTYFSGDNSQNDYFLDLGLGKVPGKTSLFKYGAGQITTSETVIWDGGDGYGGFLSSPVQLDVKSDDALDTNGGLGAWNVFIYGLDSNFDEVTEFVTLNGTSIVTTTQSFIRVYRAFIVNGGTTATAPVGGANQGAITIAKTGTSPAVTTNLMAKITENKGQTLMCIYTVPRGKTLSITGVSGAVGSGKEAVISYKFRNCETTDCVFSTKYDLTLYESAVVQEIKTPLFIPEMTDVIVTGTGGGTIQATASFGGILTTN